MFLDEVGNISLGIQAKLLRVLQEREFTPVGGTKAKKIDIRLIAATNKELEKMIREETFREDLYYRLNIVPISLPPLKERQEDIPLLATHFLKKYADEMGNTVNGFTPEAMKRLMRHSWPGNVRELENVVERSVVMIDEEMVRPEHLILPDENGKGDVNVRVPATSEELKEIKKHLREKAVEAGRYAYADLHRAPDPQQPGLRELEGAPGAGRGDKPIYTAASAESAEAELTACEVGPWGQKFPTVAASWRRAWSNVIPFFAFPPAVRRVIYTTNSIESVNARLRKIIKTRGHFPSDDAASKLIWLALRNITADWGRAAKNSGRR